MILGTTRGLRGSTRFTGRRSLHCQQGLPGGRCWYPGCGGLPRWLNPHSAVPEGVCKFYRGLQLQACRVTMQHSRGAGLKADAMAPSIHCAILLSQTSRFSDSCVAKGVVQRHTHRLHDLQADVKVRPYGVRVKDIVGAISALRATVGGNLL